ncbi:hypothetical protein BC826DRAFT_1112150 [Russula brevipes]|nr:hypothetical protein BC826DRAFT_1112150 [Russula brevipes]
MEDIASAPTTPCDPEPVVVRCHPWGFDFEHHNAAPHTQWQTSCPHLQSRATARWFTAARRASTSSTTKSTTRDSGRRICTCDPVRPRGGSFAATLEHHTQQHTREKTSHPHLQPHVTLSPWWFTATREALASSTTRSTRDGGTSRPHLQPHATPRWFAAALALGASSTTHNSTVRIVEGLDEGYQRGVEAALVLYVFREY